MKWLATVLMLVVACTLGACNTVNGFGKDLEKLGDKMQEKSKR